MDRMSALALHAGGRLIGADVSFEGAAIDSRRLVAGELFVALPGGRADGHVFVAQAAQAGAAGALVATAQPVELPQVVVPDVLAALQAHAAAHRRRWGQRVLAVTGSNGKTTVKELLANILRLAGAVHATQGNFNNHLGVPLTLLGLRAEHQAAVVELGANHPGEIAALTHLAQPQVGVVTQAGDAHLEGFGDRAGVARAKGELFAGLAADGIAIINADDAFAQFWQEQAAHCQVVSFGRTAEAEIRAADETATEQGSRFSLHVPGAVAELFLPLLGAHNVSNALAAAAAAWAVGSSLEHIVAGLGAGLAVAGRLQPVRALAGATLIDDTYNANPTSLDAALAVLARRGGRRYLVLGDMAELGADAGRLHAQAGERAARLGIERLFSTGELAAEAARSFGPAAATFADHQELLFALRAELAPDVTVLVKGSRSAQMERIVAGLAAGG